MEVNFRNINFDKDIKLPSNIDDLNLKIKTICNNLPAFKIINDVNLLNSTINQTEIFKKK